VATSTLRETTCLLPTPKQSRVLEGERKEMVRFVDNPLERVWAFGVGEEGVQESYDSGKGEHCLVVDDVFPWWWSSLKAVGVNVNRIWLTSCSEVGVSSIAISHCKGASVECGNAPTQAFLSELPICELLVIGGKIPDILMRSEMWRSTKLKTVLSTSRSRLKPPSPWKESVYIYEHSKVGGVTNGTFKIFSYTRTEERRSTESTSRRLGQDLRWVLKVNQPGEIVTQARGNVGSEPGTMVQYWKRGVVLSSGLYPINFPNTQVHTLYRGNQWVIRDLTTLERL
jgi:hypothetical protein